MQVQVQVVFGIVLLAPLLSSVHHGPSSHVLHLSGVFDQLFPLRWRHNTKKHKENIASFWSLSPSSSSPSSSFNPTLIFSFLFGIIVDLYGLGYAIFCWKICIYSGNSLTRKAYSALGLNLSFCFLLIWHLSSNSTWTYTTLLRHTLNTYFLNPHYIIHLSFQESIS